MEKVVLDAFLIYGPLGLIALLAIVVAVHKDRELTKERKIHKSEMQALEERYITKAETWMTKYHELAHAMNSVAEALVKKRGS